MVWAAVALQAVLEAAVVHPLRTRGTTSTSPGRNLQSSGPQAQTLCPYSPTSSSSHPLSSEESEAELCQTLVARDPCWSAVCGSGLGSWNSSPESPRSTSEPWVGSGPCSSGRMAQGTSSTSGWYHCGWFHWAWTLGTTAGTVIAAGRPACQHSRASTWRVPAHYSRCSWPASSGLEPSPDRYSPDTERSSPWYEPPAAEGSLRAPSSPASPPQIIESIESIINDFFIFLYFENK